MSTFMVGNMIETETETENQTEEEIKIEREMFGEIA